MDTRKKGNEQEMREENTADKIRKIKKWIPNNSYSKKKLTAFLMHPLQPMDGHSLTAHPGAMGTWWKHWGGKSNEERNWPPYPTKQMARDECLL